MSASLASTTAPACDAPPIAGKSRAKRIPDLDALRGFVAMIVSLVGSQVAPSPFSNFLDRWIVWLMGYVAVDLKQSRRALLLVLAPVILAGLGYAVLLDLRRNSATLTDAFAGTVIGLLFALAGHQGPQS